MKPALLMLGALTLIAAAWAAPKSMTGNAALDLVLSAETRTLADRSLADVKTLPDWTGRKDEERRRLREMLGLDPLPERTDLQARVTGTVTAPDFRVEKVVLQSRPGLYVTGALYLPREVHGRLPAVLYVCGHGNVKKDGISYGAKAAYQHHGAWFARNGYVCLTIDTLQLGEIEGLHHGTHREGMWWWMTRGYTPAGVEAWNGIRALDYLVSRPEVDPDRLGVTGRSGGGAYSWYVAALDERVKAAVPVAGITDLQNHVVDGTVAGHCDCMFFVNTYRWDYAQLAALVAPRPLLLANTDKDTIFPLDGVVRIHEKLRRLYDLHGAADRLGLLITEGPHKDTQDLQVPAFRWFHRWLRGDDGPALGTAEKLLEPEQLRVLAALPEDQRNTRIHETFVPKAELRVPADAAELDRWSQQWRRSLRTKSFNGWPADPGVISPATRSVVEAHLRGWSLDVLDVDTQPGLTLRLHVLRRRAPMRRVRLKSVEEGGWAAWIAALKGHFDPAQIGEDGPAADPTGWLDLTRSLPDGEGIACFSVRGTGNTSIYPAGQDRVQVLRRFYLLGQTLDGMRVWDLLQARSALAAWRETRRLPISLTGEGEAAGLALYAAVMAPAGMGFTRLDLTEPPESLMKGPCLLNALRFLDTPAAVAMLGANTPVRITTARPAAWQSAAETARRLGWPKERLLIESPPGTSATKP